VISLSLSLCVWVGVGVGGWGGVGGEHVNPLGHTVRHPVHKRPSDGRPGLELCRPLTAPLFTHVLASIAAQASEQSERRGGLLHVLYSYSTSHCVESPTPLLRSGKVHCTVLSYSLGSTTVEG
jgi:hypothetical protein